jgi:HSP20 family protein
MSSYPFNPQAEPTADEGGQPSLGTGWAQPSETQFSPRPGIEPPKIDIYDNSTEIWVVVNLPGFSEDEIRLSGDETTLVVSAERIENVEEGHNVIMQERPRELQRVVPLPAPVDITEARASYEEGVCKVTLPKTAAQRYEDIPFGPE